MSHTRVVPAPSIKLTVRTGIRAGYKDPESLQG